MPSLRFRVSGLGFGVVGLGFRVECSGCSCYGWGLRVAGEGIEVWCFPVGLTTSTTRTSWSRILEFDPSDISFLTCSAWGLANLVSGWRG